MNKKTVKLEIPEVLYETVAREVRNVPASIPVLTAQGTLIGTAETYYDGDDLKANIVLIDSYVTAIGDLQEKVDFEIRGMSVVACRETGGIRVIGTVHDPRFLAEQCRPGITRTNPRV